MIPSDSRRAFYWIVELLYRSSLERIQILCLIFLRRLFCFGSNIIGDLQIILIILVEVGAIRPGRIALVVFFGFVQGVIVCLLLVAES